MELMAEMGRVREPGDAIEVFGRGMRRAYGPLCAILVSTRGVSKAGAYRVVQVVGPDGTPLLPGRPWAERDASAAAGVVSGGVLGEMVVGGLACLAGHLDLSGDPVLGAGGVVAAVAGYRSLVATPVVDTSLPINWIVLLHPEAGHFSQADLEELILRANLVASVAKGLWVGGQLAAANQRIAREIEQIARIQRTLLPAELPQIPGLAIAAHYETFDRAGGDLYDFARLEGDPTTPADDRWGILIADASGHGPAAATVCAIVHSIMHAFPREPSGPAELLGHVNRQLCDKRIESSFVTAVLAIYQPATRELVYARAGHNPPLLLSRRAGEAGRTLIAQMDEAKGLPLGIDADATFTESRLTLAAGQMVIMYTDGIVEAKNGAGEYFGVEGLEAAARACDDEPRTTVARVVRAVRAHLGAAKASDDQTILVLQAR